MRRTLTLVSAFAFWQIAASGGAQTSEPARPPRDKDQAVRELIDITGAAKIGIQVMQQMRATLQQALPDLPESFWDEVMSDLRASDLTDLIVPIYSKHFTLEELEELIAFNKTPLGQKVIAEMPAVMQESMVAGQEWGRQLGERAYRKAEERRSKAKEKT